MRRGAGSGVRVIALAIPPGGEAVECHDCHGGEAFGHRCSTCTGHGYVITEMDMENVWSEIGEAALQVIDVVMTTDQQLDVAAKNLQSIIARAADTPHEDEENKRQSIAVFRAQLAHIVAARLALTGT